MYLPFSHFPLFFSFSPFAQLIISLLSFHFFYKFDGRFHELRKHRTATPEQARRFSQALRDMVCHACCSQSHVSCNPAHASSPIPTTSLLISLVWVCCNSAIYTVFDMLTDSARIRYMPAMACHVRWSQSCVLVFLVSADRWRALLCSTSRWHKSRQASGCDERSRVQGR